MPFGAWPSQSAGSVPRHRGTEAEIETAADDLAARLEGPDGVALRATLLSRLTHLRGAFDAKLRAGLEPEIYRRTMLLVDALASAGSVLGERNRPFRNR